MAPAGAAAALVLALASGASAQELRDGGFASSVEREWTTRAWALQPELGLAAVSDVLEDPQTSARRVAWLESCARALRAGGLARSSGAVRVALRLAVFPDPELRPRELVALADVLDAARADVQFTACWPDPDAPRTPFDGIGGMATYVEHVLPVVRLAGARAVGHTDAAGPALVALAFDEDERVARAACEGLFLRANEWPSQLEQLALSLPDALSPQEYLLWLERAEPSEALLDALAGASGESWWRATLEAVRLRHHAHADVAAIVAGWPGREGLEPIFFDAARVARAEDSELGLALIAAAENANDDELRNALFAGAVEALEPEQLLRFARTSAHFDAEAQAQIWRRLRGRVDEWDFDETREWLAMSVDPELRAEVVDTLHGSLHDGERVDTARLLALALDDPEPEIVDAAFAALCDVEPLEPWLATLFEAWRRFDPERRLEALTEIPREVPPRPFRAALIDLARTSSAARGQAIELLATLGSDAELARLAQRWLRDEVDLFLASDGFEAREHELRACSLVRALHTFGDGRILDPLVDVLARVRDESNEIGKRAIWCLGQSDAGRAFLPAWLAADVPSRLRIEAELMLAPPGDERAIDGLADDWSHCDFELRSRALRACADLSLDSARRFVESVAFDESADVPQRELALDAIAGHSLATLERLSHSPNLDVRRYAIVALGRSRDPARVGALRARLAEVERTPPDDSTDESRWRHERNALLVALARAGELAEIERAAWLRLPLDAASSDLERRFRGAPLAAIEFNWTAELEFAEALARARELARALEDAGPFERLDARLLAALGDRARDAGDLDSAERLYRAAAIGLAGEAASDEREFFRFDLRQRLLDTAERRRAWAAFEQLAREMLDDWRARRGVDRAFERAFGGFDPARGEDAVARLESSCRQARAWAALDAGKLDDADAQVRDAAAAKGYSERAASAQRKLEAALAAARAK